jgi:hypothetical protein
MFTQGIYTTVHVLISLAGIASGLVVALGMLSSKRLDALTQVFLWTTVLTSLTSFGFPIAKVTPALIVAGLSLVILAVAIFARSGRKLAGPWRPIYVVTALLALYFNVFVLVVQLFEKVPALEALAPTQSEPPFAVSQLVVLAVFVGLIVAASVKFHPERQQAGRATV